MRQKENSLAHYSVSIKIKQLNLIRLIGFEMHHKLLINSAKYLKYKVRGILTEQLKRKDSIMHQSTCCNSDSETNTSTGNIPRRGFSVLSCFKFSNSYLPESAKITVLKQNEPFRCIFHQVHGTIDTINVCLLSSA